MPATGDWPEQSGSAEQLARVLSDQAPMGMAVCDRHMRYLWHSRPWLHYHALNSPSLVGLTHYEVFPDLPESWKDEHRRCLAGETVQRERQRFVLPGGSVQWMNQTLRPWRDGHGDIGGIVFTAELVTEQVLADDARRAAEHRLRAVFDSMFEFVGLLAPDGTILEVNHTAVRAAGVPAREVIGKPFWDAPVWDRSPAAQAQLRDAIAQAAAGHFVRYEAEVRSVDGQRHPIDFSLKPVLDEAGRVVYLIPEGRDIAARRDAELALRDRDGRHHATEALAHVGSWEWEVGSGALWWSDEQYRIFGYAPRSVRPNFELFSQLLHPQDRDQVLTALELAARRDIAYDLEHRIVRPDGTVRHVRARGMADRNADGRATRMEGSVLDITDLKHIAEELAAANATIERDRALLAEHVEERTRALTVTLAELEGAREAAERANRAKSAFLAAMSHEIRTPMNGVLGAVDMLRQSKLSAEQSQLAEVIDDSAASLLRILDDILDFSKVEAGQLELENEPLCITDVVERVCDALYLMADKGQVMLSCFTDPLLPPQVLGDPVRVRQVLNNLVGNAIKFSCAGERRGHVHVRAELAGLQDDVAQVRLIVRDNGIGITPDAQARLFTPFTQADTSTTRRFGGTGLGLSICRRLADLMGATIALDSRSGEGTTFTVTLPLQVSTTETASARAHPDLQGIRCIAATPDPALAQDWRVYLEHAGASLEQAHSLDALAARLQQHGPGSLVVLVDAHGLALTQLSMHDLAAAAPGGGVSYVWLGHGLRRRPRRESAQVVSLDCDALRRGALLRAVALAAGQSLTDLDGNDESFLPTAFDTPIDLHAPPASRPMLLVVDDNEINQKLLKQQLTLLGYAAEIAGDGREALLRWRSGRHALLLTDLHMPEMDGYELTEAIRREAPQSRFPIIAFSANAMKGEAARCLAAGMNDYLSKPVQLRALKTTLERWLPRPGTGTQTEVAPAAAPLDVSVLEQLIGHQPALVDEFLKTFEESAVQAVAEVRQAAAAVDCKTLGAVGHRLKSSSRSVGAAPLADLCTELEGACKRGDSATALELARRFEPVVAAVTDAIRARRHLAYQ